MIIKLPARSRHQVLAAIALAGLATLTVSACSSGSPSSPSTPAPSSAAAPTAPAKHHHQRALRGTISAENGNAWTLNTVKGTTYTINITPTTVFGTKKAPATAQSFPIGAEVVVMGQRSGTTVNATRIATPARHDAAQPTPTTPPAPTG
ncbi:MAG: hypothetical protein ACRDQU_19435 [Pseudonocardiaceae bacterium]